MPRNTNTTAAVAAAAERRRQMMAARLAAGVKTCTKCQRVLPLGRFGPHARDGQQGWCRQCQAAYQRMRRLAADGLRRCVRCGEVKPEAEFVSRSSRNRGPTQNCLSCRNERISGRGEIPDLGPADPVAALAAITWRIAPPRPLELACCSGQVDHDRSCPLKRIRRELLMA